MRRLMSALHTFRRDNRGAFAIIAALSMPVAISAAVLGTEVGLYAFRHQSMQGAADAAALSGVVSKLTGTTAATQGKAVTASQGYADGVNGVTVTINSPPATGPYKTYGGAVEAIVAQPQQLVLAKIFGGTTMDVRARAVAIPNPGGACLLALNKSVSGAITVQGTSSVTLTGCDAFSNSANASAIVAGGSSALTVGSAGAVGGVPASSNIIASGGTYGGAAAAPDPYADKNFDTPPTSCGSQYSGGNVTLSPGLYCNGIAIQAGSTVHLSPGVYYMKDDLKIAGNATLTGDNVTIVFLSSKGTNYASAQIASNSVVNLSAPTTGPTAGIVLFGDRNMTAGTSFKLTGGGTQQWSGAIYLPKGDLTYAGGASGGAGCTQIIASTVTFVGNSNLSLSCAGSSIKPAGNQMAVLVE